MQQRSALTFAKSFLEPFSVDMSEDVMRLPVEVSEGQLAEQLISVTGGQHMSARSDSLATFRSVFAL